MNSTDYRDKFTKFNLTESYLICGGNNEKERWQYGTNIVVYVKTKVNKVKQYVYVCNFIYLSWPLKDRGDQDVKL